jgi:hypothetical protein
MKQCRKCQEAKPLDEFRNKASSKDGKEPRCKACRREHDNNTYRDSPERRASIRKHVDARRLELKKFVRQYLESNPCVDCGQSDADLLEFDHLRDKSCGISSIIAGASSMQRLLDEIDKCVVRCLYCHRKKTIKQLGWYQWVTSPQ